MKCEHCKEDNCEGCECIDYAQTFKFVMEPEEITPAVEFEGRTPEEIEDLVDALNKGEVNGPMKDLFEEISNTVHVDLTPIMVCLCQVCAKPQEIIREGIHFQNDLHILLRTVGSMMFELDKHIDEDLEWVSE